MRFYELDGGVIEVDGRDITTLTRDSLRRSFGMVLQETWLFDGTVAENIAYGRPNATMDEITAAAKAAYAHSFIKRLPEGYQTMIEGGGANLSAGQKQLLTIARAMLADTSMLILDEATSNVDILTEIRIQKAFRSIMEGKTTFIIAHRLSTIRDADVILVMDKGDVVEAGTHEELLQKEGIYKTLVQKSMENPSEMVSGQKPSGGGRGGPLENRKMLFPEAINFLFPLDFDARLYYNKRVRVRHGRNRISGCGSVW